MFLEGSKCYLKTLQVEDVHALTKLVRDNKHYWSIFEPLHTEDYYTEHTQYKKILESLEQMKISREFSFGIYKNGTSTLIGHISLYSVKRLPFSSAFIGYSIDKSAVGQGLATEAVELVVKFAIEKLRLHRIEAYVSPKNIGSIRVLEKSGFRQEGLLKQLLYINGVWEDHYMYSLLDTDY